MFGDAFCILGIMKSIQILKKAVLVQFIIVGSLFSARAQSVTGEEVLAKFYKTLDDLETLHYSISTVDSFISGNVWVQNGEAMLVRDRTSKEFPFKLYGMDDRGNEMIFDGKQAIVIRPYSKEFSFLENYYKAFVGAPGGQMLFSELLFREEPFNPETGIGYNRLDLNELSEEYVLTIHYPQNVMFGIRSRVKILTINKKTWIPVSYYHKITGFDGEKQVNTRKLENIKVNTSTFQFPTIDTAALIGYHEVGRRKTPTYPDLLNTTFIDMELKSTDGLTAKLSDKKGKVILLDFWEIWCGPCIESMPKVKDFVKKYSSDKFEVWGIVLDEKTFTKVPATVKRIGINFPVYFGTEQTKKDYRVTGVPEYVIIDQSGKIAFITAGFSDEIEKKLDELLK